MDQRSGAGWFIRRIEVLTISFCKDFCKFRDAGREDCFCSEQDHPEFSLQEEGPSRGTESPEGGPVSTRKTDRLHDLRQLSSDWRSWSSIRLCWFFLSPFMTTMFRNSKQDGMKFYYLCQRFPQMISLKVCTSWEYVSPRNLKPYWNCTTWKIIRKYRCPMIKNWKRRWREA